MTSSKTSRSNEARHHQPRSKLGFAMAGLLLLGACNAVLDIEEAGPIEQAIVSCDWPPGDPTTQCPTCESCATCPVGECLADKACREMLPGYLRCVGDDCTAESGSCDGCLSADASSSKAKDLAECVATQCAGCQLAGVFTLCEAYCACMDDRCSETEPGGAYDECMKACANGSDTVADPHDVWGGPNEPAEDWRVYCLWTHCEKASRPNDGFHCLHAIGDGLCQEKPEPDPNPAVCEYPKGYGNAPCNSDADCCATCTDDGICTSP